MNDPLTDHRDPQSRYMLKLRRWRRAKDLFLFWLLALCLVAIGFFARVFQEMK